jgi:hypothetical protein
VSHWLRQRAQYVENASNLEWVLHDPIVNCLLPALYVLNKKDGIHLSEGVREAVKNIYLSNKARWMVSEYRLKRILGLFYQAGIAVIPLKGAILQSLLYRNSGIRSMDDIDILVHPENYKRSASLLIQSGLMFAPTNRFQSLMQLDKIPDADWPGELSFRDGQGLAIDLHRNLMPSQWFSTVYCLDINSVWERSILLSDEEQVTKTAGAGLWKRLLSPYDMLAHLCLHAALHGLQNTKSYLDIDLWVRNPPAAWDWSRFMEIANQWRIRSAVFHVMMICVEFMGTPVPDDVLKQMDPGWLARWRVRQLISPKILMADRPSLGKRYPTLLKIALADHIAEIFLSIVKLIFPGKSMYTRHHARHGIIGHWLHVLEVIKRGD